MSPVRTSNSVKCVSPPPAFGDPSAFCSLRGTVNNRVPNLYLSMNHWLTKHSVAPLSRNAGISAFFKAVWKETGIRMAFNFGKNTLLWNTARVKAVLLRLGKNPRLLSTSPRLPPSAGTRRSVDLGES